VLLIRFYLFSNNACSVWDWSKKKKVVTFNNGNPAGSAITGVHFVNEDAQTMILTASGMLIRFPWQVIFNTIYLVPVAEGTIRIFRNYDVQRRHDPMEMVTSFRALNHTIPLQKGSGLVCDWQQESGLLVCGGDSRVVRVWDGFQELCLAVSFSVIMQRFTRTHRPRGCSANRRSLRKWTPALPQLLLIPTAPTRSWQVLPMADCAYTTGELGAMRRWFVTGTGTKAGSRASIGKKEEANRL
jgi:WD40 repeat protein